MWIVGIVAPPLHAAVGRWASNRGLPRTFPATGAECNGREHGR